MIIKKECIICKENKNLTDFPPRKDSKDGRRNNCRICEKNKKKKYYKENKEYFKVAHKEYADNNKSKIREYRVSYEKENKDKIKNKNREYYLKNKKEINKKSQIIRKRRLKNDPLFKLKCSIHNSIHRGFRRSRFNKNSKTIEILGCTYKEFRERLELKFEPWMTWDNYGKYNGENEYGWDLDHIIPVSSATTEDELIKLNHYINFQPLCSHINRDIKKDNY